MTSRNNDPMLFETPALENANMTVLHCREVLEKTGLTNEARQLEGLELTDRNIAKVALGVLNSLRVKAEAEYARALAVANIRDALRS